MSAQQVEEVFVDWGYREESSSIVYVFEQKQGFTTQHLKGRFNRPQTIESIIGHLRKRWIVQGQLFTLTYLIRFVRTLADKKGF